MVIARHNILRRKGQFSGIDFRTAHPALEIRAAARTAVKCWRKSPGRLRPARIFSMQNGACVAKLSVSAVRKICPPPSLYEPSMVSI